MNKDMDIILLFLRQLLSAIANATLYSMAHPQVQRLSGQAFDSLLKVLEARQEFSLSIIDTELVIDEQPQEFSLFLDRFIQMLADREISHITVSQGISSGEIKDFIAAMSRKGNEYIKTINSSEHIKLGQIGIQTTDDSMTGSFADNIIVSAGNPADTKQDTVFNGSLANSGKSTKSLLEMPAEDIAKFSEIYDAVKNNKKLKISGVYEVVSDFIETFRQEGRALLVMAALRNTDEYTFTHSTNVCILNIAQAKMLGIEGQMLNDIGVAGMLHDIGKLFIPEEIITKEGKLTNKEFAIIQEHPIKGARYLLDTPGVPKLAVANAFEHHIKYNFSGYPKVPDGWQQNLCSHLTAISDFFDALRTNRSYRATVESNEIAELMLNMLGTELHPVLTKNFLKMLSSLK